MLFELTPIGALATTGFDVTPDGRSFAMVRGTGVSDSEKNILFVENWFEEFRKR